jgi:hypothetical protein
MGIHKIMTNALNTKFSLTDDFQFTFGNKMFSIEGSPLPIQELLEICTINVDVTALDAALDAQIMGGSYRIKVSRYQPFIINITFRDIYGLKLREYFTKIWMAQQTQYFDDIKSNIKISVENNVIFSSNDCLINNISQINFDNNNTQITEFTVSFTSPYMSNSNTSNFGEPGHVVAGNTSTSTNTVTLTGTSDIRLNQPNPVPSDSGVGSGGGGGGGGSW